MKRHQIVMAVCGGLMAVLCVAACWLLWSAISVKRAAAEERNMNYEELQQIYRAKVFPIDANIGRVRDDQKALEEWLVAASNLLRKGEMVIDKRTPPIFKQVLQRSVRELSDHPGAAGGKIVGQNFYFGFDRYLGQSDSLPEQEHVDRLSFQLGVIETVCKELYAANILELKSVAREAFDGGATVAQAADAGAATPRRRRRDTSRSDAPQQPVQSAAAAAGGEYYTKERFTFEFVTRPAAFVEVLNRLSALDLFVVVAEVDLRKTSDPLKAAEGAAARAGGRDGAAAETPVDPATLTHAQRIVSDPELEPPVNVKLEIDVYSFEGV
jgi:hypothetical protein